jgi:hypothetical protein
MKLSPFNPSDRGHTVSRRGPSAQRVPATRRDLKTLGLLLGTTCALLVTLGALNGGAALTPSTWDAIKNYLAGMLGSSFVISLALVALVVCVWQIAHGRGYGHVGTVLGILAVALLGPGMVTAASTSTREPVAVTEPAAARQHADALATRSLHAQPQRVLQASAQPCA